MKIKIDGKEIIVSDPRKNIVEIAAENGISITAPCFRSKRKHGCCGACLIEVNGNQKYACKERPYDGMIITYNDAYLASIRKSRLQKYSQSLKSNTINSINCCDGSCCCGPGCCD